MRFERKSPIRRSDRKHSLTVSRRDRGGEVATLPRVRNLRNFQNCEGRRVSLHLFFSMVAKQQPPNTYAQASSRTSGDRNLRYDRSSFEAPTFRGVIRAKPKLYYSLPTNSRQFSYESNSTREPKFRSDLRPTLGSRTSRNPAPHRLRKPSLELSEMDQLICNMLSVSMSAPDRTRSINSDLQEFGVL